MSGHALTRSPHSSSSCLWRRENFILMILMSLISFMVLLPLVSSEISSSGSNANAEALTADPHAGTQSDTPSHEKAATKDPVIESEGGRYTYHEGDTAVLDCVVRDLGDHAKIWRIGMSHLLFAGPQVIKKNPRMSQIGEHRSLQIKNLSLNDTNDYICQVAAKENSEIKYEVKVLPASMKRDPSTSAPPGAGHANHPLAKNHSNSSLNPSSTSAVCYNTVTGIALLSLFLNNYFVHQA